LGYNVGCSLIFYFWSVYMDLVYKDKKQLKKCNSLVKILKQTCNYDLDNLNTIII